MELTFKIIITLLVAAGSLAFGGLLGTAFGLLIGAEGLLMAICQCAVAGWMLGRFVNVLTE